MISRVRDGKRMMDSSWSGDHIECVNRHAWHHGQYEKWIKKSCLWNAVAWHHATLHIHSPLWLWTTQRQRFQSLVSVDEWCRIYFWTTLFMSMDMWIVILTPLFRVVRQNCSELESRCISEIWLIVSWIRCQKVKKIDDFTLGALVWWKTIDSEMTDVLDQQVGSDLDKQSLEDLWCWCVKNEDD